MLFRVNTLVTIGDFSRMTFLSVKTLRHYHEVGLLTPADVDPDTGYRRYEVEQVPTAQAIRRLRELGMPVEDVRAVIEAPDVQTRNAAITEHLRRMEGELDRTRATVKSLRLLLDEKPARGIPIDYRTVGPSETLAIRTEIAHDDAFVWLDGAFDELRTALDADEGRRAGPDAALFSGRLLEDEFGELVALIPVEAAASTEGRIAPLRLPRVEYAVAVHEGPVDDADRTYAALGTVVAERAIGVEGPIREDYIVGARETADETKHRIEICWPVFQTGPA
jgi:DNA-binding transcriptional MerR regulator